jgi:hypothetical protein
VQARTVQLDQRKKSNREHEAVAGGFGGVMMLAVMHGSSSFMSCVAGRLQRHTFDSIVAPVCHILAEDASTSNITLFKTSVLCVCWLFGCAGFAVAALPESTACSYT